MGAAGVLYLAADRGAVFLAAAAEEEEDEG